MSTDQETWLHQNEIASSLVMEGLQQAKSGKFSETPPDLEADAALVAELQEDS